MGKITGFIEIERHDRPYAPVPERMPPVRERLRTLWTSGAQSAAFAPINGGYAWIGVLSSRTSYRMSWTQTSYRIVRA